MKIGNNCNSNDLKKVYVFVFLIPILETDFKFRWNMSALFCADIFALGEMASFLGLFVYVVLWCFEECLFLDGNSLCLCLWTESVV